MYRTTLFLWIFLVNPFCSQGQSADVILKTADSLLNWNQTDKAIALLSDLDEIVENRSNEQLRFLNLKVRAFLKMGSYPEVQKVLMKIEEVSLLLDEPNAEQLAMFRLYEGQYYFRVRDSKLATQSLQRANSLSENIVQHSNLKASIFNWIGNVHKYRNYNYDSALFYYQQALDSWDKKFQGDPVGLARIYINLSTTYRSMNAFIPAKTYANNALGIIEPFKKINQPLYASCLSSLGNIAYSLSQYKEATKYYQEIVSLTEVKKDRGSPQLVTYYQNIGTLFLEQKTYDSALFYHRKSLLLRKGMDSSKEAVSHNLMDVGTSYMLLGLYDSAQWYFGRAERILSEQKETFDAVHGRLARSIGDLYVRRLMLDSAMKYYQHGLNQQVDGFQDLTITSNPPIDLVKNNFEVVSLLNAKGRATLQLYLIERKNEKLLDAALQTLLLAEEITEHFRKKLSEYDFNTILSNHVFELNENTIHAATLKYHQTDSSKYLELAYTFMEKSKSLHLLKSLMAAFSYGDLGLNKTAAQFEIRISQELSAKLEALSVERQRSDRDTLKVNALLNDLMILQQKSDSISLILSQKFPEYSAIKHTLIQKNLSDVQNYAKTNEVQILEYFMGKERCFVLQITPDTIRLHQSEVNDQVLDELENVMRHLRDGSSVERLALDAKQYALSASVLYKNFMEPILDKNYSKLIIVPNQALAYLPFDALVKNVSSDVKSFKDLQYLIRDYDINYAYSLQLLLRETNTNSKRSAVLALSYSNGPEIVSQDNQMISGGLRAETQFSNVPGTARELSAISHSFEGDYIFGEHSTETLFKQKAGDYGILHLAIHGVGENDDNTLPHLIFRNEIDSLNDGFLYPYEVYNSSFKADLVVLSGCETGVGRNLRGEGVYSMARAFSYAGVPTMVMSLWNVNDYSTSQLMSSFYSELSKGLPINDALQKAKRNFLKDSNPISAHPTNWAALVSLGQNRIVVESSNIVFWVLGSVFLILILFWAIKSQRKKPFQQKA